MWANISESLSKAVFGCKCVAISPVRMCHFIFPFLGTKKSSQLGSNQPSYFTLLETRGFPSQSHGRFGFVLMFLTERFGLKFSSGGYGLCNIGVNIIGVDQNFRLKSAEA